MASKPLKTAKLKAGLYREEWPRIRAVTIRGVDFFQCDGRPHYQRKTFSSLVDARKQAEKWESTRTRYGTAGRYISEKDASRFAEALDLLAPYGVTVTDAARYYAKHLDLEKLRASSKPVADALLEWSQSYETKDRDSRTLKEIKYMAGVFTRTFGGLKLNDLTADLLLKWVDGYETMPGKPAKPQTRANFRTKLSQFLNFSKLKGWIENNPLLGIKVERPPRASIEIFDVKQVLRIVEAADRNKSREIVLPYAVICLFAGLRPNSEAELLEWRDINFSTGDT